MSNTDSSIIYNKLKIENLPQSALIETKFVNADLDDVKKTILEADKSDNINTDSDYITSSNSNINISISKVNNSFSFADKFRSYLINNTFKTTEKVTELLQSSSEEINRVLYERTQNFISNIVDTDTCHYRSLLTHFQNYDIDISNVVGRNFPEELEYLLNVFSIDKTYFKSNFYTMQVYDEDVTTNINNITNITDLQNLTQVLNRKYFDNFYETTVYNIVKNELYSLYQTSEAVKEYIDVNGSGIYDKAITGISQDINQEKYTKYIFLNLLKTTISTDGMEAICNKAMYNFLQANPLVSPVAEATSDITGYYIVSDYFLKVFYDNQITNGSTLDLSNYTNLPDNSMKLIFNAPTIDDIYSMFETYVCSANDFITIQKIKLLSADISNICRKLCQLRQDIKEIKTKDSKIGTALLIEELICDYIYKALTKKVGLTNQKYKENPTSKGYNESLEHLNNTDTDTTYLKTALKEINEREQKVVDIEFENYLSNLKTIVQSLDISIKEYIDTTPSYLNINQVGVVDKQLESYRKLVTKYYSYLDDDFVVYPDFNDHERVEFDNYATKYQPEPLTDPSWKITIPQIHQWQTTEREQTFYFIDGKIVSFANHEVPSTTTGGITTYYYIPKTEFNLTQAPAEVFVPAEWDSNYLMFINQTTNASGRLTKTVYDKYTRAIDFTEYKRLISNNDNSTIITWENDWCTNIASNDIFIIEYATGFTEQVSHLELIASADQNTYVEPIVETTIYYGLYRYLNADGDWVLTDDSTTPGAVWTSFVQRIDNITKAVYSDNKTVWIQLLNGNIVNTLEVSATKQFARYTSSTEFKVIATGEEIFYEEASKALYDEESDYLNNYEIPKNYFYANANTKEEFVIIKNEVTKPLLGNTPFWNNLTASKYNISNTIEEEVRIIQFYKDLGLVDTELSEQYSMFDSNGIETLSPSWATARARLIGVLKDSWNINAQHKWFTQEDQERFNNGEISETLMNDLKLMDISYGSVLGESMKKNQTKAINNSLLNLDNWENHTVAIHPCIWNLVEQTYNDYYNILTCSLYGDTILEKIYNEARSTTDRYGNEQPPEEITTTGAEYNIDKEGLFAFERDGNNIISAHMVDFWKFYGKSFFPYTTKYEESNNALATGDSMSRFIDFPGPFNYEALLSVIDKQVSAKGTDYSLRDCELGWYYIDCDRIIN